MTALNTLKAENYDRRKQNSDTGIKSGKNYYEPV